MNLKELIFLLWYSLKAFTNEMISLIMAFKKPETWFYLAIATFIITAYYRKIGVMLWSIPMMIIIYIIRQKQEGIYKAQLKEKAFLRGDEDILQEEYEKYIKNCFYKIPKVSPMSYDEWKLKEKEEIEKAKQ